MLLSWLCFFFETIKELQAKWYSVLSSNRPIKLISNFLTTTKVTGIRSISKYIKLATTESQIAATGFAVHKPVDWISVKLRAQKVVQMEPMRVKSLFKSLPVFALAAYKKKSNLEAELNSKQSIVSLASSHFGVWGEKGEGWIDGKGLFSVPHLPSPSLREFSNVIHGLKEFTAPKYIP